MQDLPFANRAQLDRRIDGARQLRAETLGMMIGKLWRAGRVSPGDLLGLGRRSAPNGAAALGEPPRVGAP